MSIILGSLIEKRAKHFLVKQGLEFIEANFHSRFGEIDLVMKKDELLIFVEVRARKSKDYGSALESVTLAKQNKIIKTALHYLDKNNLMGKCAVRFDVLVAEGVLYKMEWIPNAFDA